MLEKFTFWLRIVASVEIDPVLIDTFPLLSFAVLFPVLACITMVFVIFAVLSCVPISVVWVV